VDEAQYAAGRRYQGDLERSQLGRLASNFPRHQRVQGGKAAPVLTPAMLAANDRLHRAREILDSDRIRLLEDVLAGRIFPDGTVERDLRWTLDLLAFHYGLAGGSVHARSRAA